MCEEVGRLLDVERLRLRDFEFGCEGETGREMEEGLVSMMDVVAETEYMLDATRLCARRCDVVVAVGV